MKPFVSDIQIYTNIHISPLAFTTNEDGVLNGKVNRRIDVLLDVLLKIKHDQFFSMS